MFKPVPDSLLESKGTLTASELKILEDTIAESWEIVEKFGALDKDVLEYHSTYADRVIRRLMADIAANR